MPIVDVFQTGDTKVSMDRSHRYLLTCNRSDDAEQDVPTALAWMKSIGTAVAKRFPHLTAGVWAIFSAAVAPEKVAVAGGPSFDGSDAAFVKSVFFTGIQRAGGWARRGKLAAY